MKSRYTALLAVIDKELINRGLLTLPVSDVETEPEPEPEDTYEDYILNLLGVPVENKHHELAA